MPEMNTIKNATNFVIEKFFISLIVIHHQTETDAEKYNEHYGPEHGSGG